MTSDYDETQAKLNGPRLLRAWATLNLPDPPGEVAEAAARQARSWEATGREEDTRFSVAFSETYSDADMALVGREEDLLPVLEDVLAVHGFSYHADARTEGDAERLYALRDVTGERIFTVVGHDPYGDWGPNDGKEID